MLETVIKTIAIHSHFETFSLNRNNAIKVVAMISKLPSREAFADVLLLPAKVGIMVMAYQAELHCAIQV
ncbi:MAG: hypothetical protein K2N78_07725, partial [Oscillospiraceae bacterium]|nr:hypothetical protein [Oscillospiraceae bacterium]